MRRADQPVPQSLAEVLVFAAHASNSNYFPDVYEESQCVVKIMAGQELGIGAVSSLRNIKFIEGQINLSAKLVASLVKSSGRYDFRVVSLDNKHCKLEFFQRSLNERSWESVGFSEYGEEDAKRQGLFDRGVNYKKIPKNMYWSRAMSNGVGWFCPDVTMGACYTPEEMRPGDFDDEGNAITKAGRDAINVAPKKSTAKAVTATTSAIQDAEIVYPVLPTLEEFKILSPDDKAVRLIDAVLQANAQVPYQKYLAEAKVKAPTKLTDDQKNDLYSKLLLRLDN